MMPTLKQVWDAKLSRLTLVDAEFVGLEVLRRIGKREPTRFDLHTSWSIDVPDGLADWISSVAERIREGEPPQYAIGSSYFLNERYEIGPGVLIPRQETEVLALEVDAAITFSSAANGLEVGVGSGIVSISLLQRHSALKMLATEASSEALRYAERNARRILADDAERLRLISVEDPTQVFSELGTDLRGSFDFIVSNPPYLHSESEATPSVWAHEPMHALKPLSGDPLGFYRAFAGESRRWLKPAGFVIVEIPHERAATIQSLFQDHGWKTRIVKDLNERERVLEAR